MAAEFNIKNGFISNNNSIVQGTLTANTINLSDTTLAGSGSLNGSVLNIAQTWNTSGLPTAIKLNVTDTTSATLSLLMDLQITGTSKFSVTKDGTVTAANGFRQNIYQASSTNAGVSMRFNGAGFLTTWGLAVENAGQNNLYNSTGGTFNYIQLSATTFNPTTGTAVFNGYQFGSVINQASGATGISRGVYINPILTSAADFRAIETTNGTVIHSDIYMASGTTTGSLLNLSQTWNTTGAPTAVKLNVTDSGSTSSSLLMDLQTNGVSQFRIRKDGVLNLTGTITSGSISSSNQVSAFNFRCNNGGTAALGARFESSNVATTSDVIDFGTSRIFNPISGSTTFTFLQQGGSINQTGTATGITRGLYINPNITFAYDYRAIEVTAGKIVFSSTITPPGTTGAQTINKISGKVNAAAGTTSLVVTNSGVTTSSIVLCQLGTNDASCVIKSVVEGTNSFTINYSAPTAETIIKFLVIN